MTNILFIGDIEGRPGRRALNNLINPLREQYQADIVIGNCENAAGGIGLTKPTAKELLDAGIDVITLGNHAFGKRDVYPMMDSEPRILRPANFPPGAPGKGWGIYTTPAGDNIAVINLIGRVYMDPLDCPFRCADEILGQIANQAKIIFVDLHAEATSEKKAMGWYLDGKVSAIIGTHTHVQTSDERVLPNGTAYLTDAGMTGVHDSVLGLEKNLVIDRFIKQIPGKFELAEGVATLQGAVVSIDPSTGLAASIQRISIAENSE